MMDEPPQLDIGEPVLHLPGSGLDVTNIDNQFYLRMPGRPSPSCTSRQDLDMATHTGGVSPSRSPRLPSPPPFTEVQIGPKSPTIGASATGNEHELGGVNKPDIGATRRIRPGTKAADMASGPPLVPLAELDSPFQLQEHLKALYHTHTKPASSTNSTPITRTTALLLAHPPENIERSLWLYELCRFLTQKANNLIVAFFAETPPCSAQTCPEMRASEWQYLCAVHDPPKSCCAIDYCCHTLDWASSILTSQKHFPSRLTLGSESTGGTQQGVRQLTNIFRRVYRIFAHAWFQHRQVFWQVEGHDGLYVFFKTVCDVYNLIPEDNYTIPPEAEGIISETPGGEEAQGPMAILKRDDNEDVDANMTTTISTGTTTRRHKHTPSTGSAVTTIAEGDEDDKDSKVEPDNPSAAVAPSASEEPIVQDPAPTEKEPPVPLQETETNTNTEANPEPNPDSPSNSPHKSKPKPPTPEDEKSPATTSSDTNPQTHPATQSSDDTETEKEKAEETKEEKEKEKEKENDKGKETESSVAETTEISAIVEAVESTPISEET